ncbi:MAG: LEA type 2 family protein [Gemmatimonadetes bacterium]|nr:LEA type 2 family protein [Gemmatimonadota bacterium]
MMRRTMLLAVLALLTIASRCTGFRKPIIDLEGVELGSVGLSGGTILVNVRVENPNPVGFRAERVNYELFLRTPRDSADQQGWERLTSGTHEEDIVVRGGETRVVQIPVEFRLSELGPVASSILRTGRFNYRVTGDVQVRAAGSRRTVPFRKTGSMSLLGGR